MDDWQPIETAPREIDSEILILESFNEDEPIDIAHWVVVGGWENKEGFSLSPTHWMPLPDRR